MDNKKYSPIDYKIEHSVVNNSKNKLLTYFVVVFNIFLLISILLLALNNMQLKEKFDQDIHNLEIRLEKLEKKFKK